MSNNVFTDNEIAGLKQIATSERETDRVLSRRILNLAHGLGGLLERFDALEDRIDTKIKQFTGEPCEYATYDPETGKIEGPPNAPIRVK